jgi:hypothetical protein
LVVLVMMFTMVSISEAGFFWWSPYRCGIESPAYTDYIDARAIPCPAEVSVGQGSPIERQRSRVKFPPFRNNSFF